MNGERPSLIVAGIDYAKRVFGVNRKIASTNEKPSGMSRRKALAGIAAGTSLLILGKSRPAFAQEETPQDVPSTANSEVTAGGPESQTGPETSMSLAPFGYLEKYAGKDSSGP